MQTTAQAASVSKKSVWAGWIFSGLALLVFAFTGVFGVLNPAAAAQGFAHYGYPDGIMLRIGAVELVCAILYAIPQTSVLGAILLTGYLGGATATHLRVGEPYFIPIVVGIVLWLGLYLRDPRLRALVPLRTSVNP